MERKYLLRPDPEDERDFKLTISEAVPVPRKVDLRDKCPPIFDQGQLGSCTANAGVAAFMMLKGLSTELSRLFLYYQERLLEGTTDQDAGASMRDIGKALNKYGVCMESLWPYIESRFAIDPPDPADLDAAARKVTAYKKLDSVTAIKQYLSINQMPVMIGIPVYESFESRAVAKDGIVPIPDANEELLGGHAVLIVGYDDDFGKTNEAGKSKGFWVWLLDLLFGTSTNSDSDGGYLIVRNSWGPDWGDKGYFYLPYAFVKKYAYDFWVLE